MLHFTWNCAMISVSAKMNAGISERRCPLISSTDNSPSKHCPKCNQSYPATLDYFYRDPNGGQDLSGYCKTCSKSYAKANRTPQKNRAYHLKHYPTVRESRIAYQRQWNKTNRANRIALKQSYRARRHNLPTRFSDSDWERALNYFGGCCAVCGKPSGLWHTLAADHWIPVTSPDCPGTIPTNIVPLCHSQKDGEDGCNNTKHNRDAAEWLTERYGKRKAKQILARIQTYFDSFKEKQP